MKKRNLRELCISNKRQLISRLETYYFFTEIKQSPTFSKNLRLAEKYFLYKKLRKRGLTNFRIAKKLELNHVTVMHWKKQTPILIKIASQIPTKSLLRRFKWLNLSMVGQWKYKDFIKVPSAINNFRDLQYVLKQINSLDTIKNKVESINKLRGFGYVLGLMISDADKDNGSRLSTRLRLGLSKRYDWNLDIGEAFCYSLNTIGLRADRVKDGKRSKRCPNGKYIWRSQLSPFVTWIKQVGLGLRVNQTTTYNKVKMEWLLNCPKELIVWVLNGIYDGDGCAYVRGWQITNAARPNQEFINKLLNIFNIKSVTRGPKSVIETKKSLELAASLPIFRFAIGKVEKANEIILLMKNSNKICLRYDYLKIMKRVHTLHQTGFQPKEIPNIIYDEFNVGIHPRRIYTILERGDLFDK